MSRAARSLAGSRFLVADSEEEFSGHPMIPYVHRRTVLAQCARGHNGRDMRGTIEPSNGCRALHEP
ncbi:MAG: hypothetical protein ACM3ZE_11780, partial [Myxococcales bacterium]